MLVGHLAPGVWVWCVRRPDMLLDLHSGKGSESGPHMLGGWFWVAAGSL